MKKELLIILLLIVNVYNSFAQFPEDFEGSFPPLNWTVDDNEAGLGESWEHSNESFSGSKAAFISYENAGEGVLTEDWLITPQFTPTASLNMLTFYQKQEFNLDFGAKYKIRVSTVGTSLVDFVNLVETQVETTFDRSYSVHSVDLKAFNDVPIYVAFILEQEDGDSWFIDKINLEDPLSTIPNCAINPAPTISQTDVDVISGNVILDWDPSATGFSPSAYDVYTGTSSGSLSLVADEVANTTFTMSGLLYNTEYFWSIVPKNFVGNASSCTEWSFTTELEPVAPSNDDCGGALDISSVPYENTQDASSATNNSGFITTCFPGMNDGVWYTFQSGIAGTVTIDITNVSGAFDPEVALYSGSCGGLICVDSVDDNLDGISESLSANINASTQYWINVGHYSSSTDSPEGVFKITVNLGGGATLGIDKLDNQLAINLYPNPTNDILNFSSIDIIEEIRIVNLLGQEVLKVTPNKNKEQVDVSNLTKGLYLVRVQSGNKKGTYRILKK